MDGIIARKTNSTSDFGSKLDSAADLIFVLAALVKLLPAMSIPIWVWIWILIIAVIKIINMIWSLLSKKKILVEHTFLNKITGLLLFVLPLTLAFIELKYSAFVVCAVATIAAVQEGHYIRWNRSNLNFL